MAWIKRFTGILAGALVLASVTQPAGAVNLWNGNAVGQSNTAGGSITYDGLVITATSCTLKVGGTNFGTTQGGCGAFGLQFMVVTSSSNSSQVTIEITGAQNSTGAVTVNGTNYNTIFSTASTFHDSVNNTNYSEAVTSTAGHIDDLKVSFSITDATGSKAAVNNIGATITGSDTGTAKSTAEANDIGISETYTSSAPVESGNVTNIGGAASVLAIGSVSGYSGTASSSVALATPSTNYTVTKDITIGNATAPNASDTLTLSDVTQTFKLKTPEPASVAVLLVGLAGLAAARRYRRR